MLPHHHPSGLIQQTFIWSDYESHARSDFGDAAECKAEVSGL